MRSHNLNKTWGRLTAQIHREKSHSDNRTKREALFALQILLSQFALAKKERSKKPMKFYAGVLKIYEKYGVLA